MKMYVPSFLVFMFSVMGSICRVHLSFESSDSDGKSGDGKSFFKHKVNPEMLIGRYWPSPKWVSKNGCHNFSQLLADIDVILQMRSNRIKIVYATTLNFEHEFWAKMPWFDNHQNAQSPYLNPTENATCQTFDLNCALKDATRSQIHLIMESTVACAYQRFTLGIRRRRIVQHSHLVAFRQMCK